MRLKNIIAEIKNDDKTNKKYLEKFEKTINDDLDMPNALQILWNLLRDKNADGKIETIKKMDEIFGLDLLKKEKIIVPKEIRMLSDERNKARKNKNWNLSDKLREKINKLGYLIEDVQEGYVLKKRKNGSTI